jgi:hypothetical protein
MEVGSPVDLRTGFFSRKKGDALEYQPREEILAILDAAISDIPDIGDRRLVELVDKIAKEQREGVGPWSPFKPYSQDGPKKVAAVISDKSLPSSWREGAWKKALFELSSFVPRGSVRVLSIDDAVRGLRGSEGDPEGPLGMDTSTNSGSPFFLAGWYPGDEVGQKAAEKAEAYQWYASKAEELIKVCESEDGQIPGYVAIVSQRLVQKGKDPYGPKNKRMVIAFPKHEAIMGRTFSLGVMEQLRKVKMHGVQVMCGWTDLPTIDDNMQRMLKRAESRGRIVLSGDVSAYDATLPPQIIRDVGYVIADWVRGRRHLIREMVDAMIERTSLITPTKYWRGTPSSLKSGSSLTNLIGSMANIAIQLYGKYAKYYEIETLAVLGDDFVLDGNGVSPDATSKTFQDFGMESHPDKQFFEHGALHYLQRLHYLGRPGGMYDVYRALGHALGLERQVSRSQRMNKYAYIVRALSQAQNCVFHPYFLALIETLKMGDKLDLGAEFADPMVLVQEAGTPGEQIIKQDVNAPWKSPGSGTSFKDWPVNGVLRGEKLPEAGEELFIRVHGRKPEM